MGWTKGLATFGLLAAVWTFTPIGDDEGNTKKWGAVVAMLLFLNVLESIIFYNANEPPHVGGGIPWFGNIVSFGEKPVDFLLDCYKKHGPVFSFTMFGERVYYLLGSDASKLFWSSSNDKLNAEDLYANITVPIFGKGVAFDIPNKVFSEQKMMAKRGLTQKRFETYTAKVEEECRNYINDRWKGDSGDDNLFEAMAEMIVFTATRCLHGQETRDAFTADTAALYSDLDGGFSPLAWLFPNWIPFPSFLKRDRAHVELKKRFNAVIDARRKVDQTEATDLLQTFTTSHYEKVNDKRALTNDEVSGLLIALLMAGQHTSSTTSTWFGFFMCDKKEVGDLQDRLYREQIDALGENPGPITLADLDKMPLLHACTRETLRLRPPIMQLMRNVREPLDVTANGKTYTIPKGAQVCVSPSFNGRNSDEWEESFKFKPERFMHEQEDGSVQVTHGEQLENGDTHKFKWVPFGAGRHRCIGFEFAQIQIRCVWSLMLRNFDIQLKDGKFPATNFQTMIHTPLNPYVTWTRRKPGTVV